MELKFATPETVKQPTGGLILEERAETDYILGAFDPKGLGQVLIEDGHWTPYLPVQEIQRVRDGDTYGCTGYSDNNVDEFIHKRKYGYEINISDMFVVVGSGNVRGVGNTMKAPAEFKRTKGLVFESDYAYSREMTLDEFYALIPKAIYDKAEQSLTVYKTGYLSVNGTGQQTLLEALKVSPNKVAIEGRYIFDADGRIRNDGSPYNHAVVLFDYVLDSNGNVKEYWIFDSETEQFLRFRGDYAFLSPMVKFLEKKTFMLYKKLGEPALYIKHWSENLLIPFSDGVVAGGDVFKTLYSVTSYKDLPRKDVDVLPYPVASYGISTTNLNLSKFE